MTDKAKDNTGILKTVGSGQESGKGTVIINNEILEFSNTELLNALDPTTKSALKALVAVGAARIPEGVVL